MAKVQVEQGLTHRYIQILSRTGFYGSNNH